MINSFFGILKKSFLIIKKEPVILIPYLMFNLSMVMLTQFYAFSEKHVVLNSFVEWVIPTIIVQPFILLIALKVIQEKPIHIQGLFQQQQQCMWPFCIASLYKPMVFYSAYRLMNVLPKEATDASSLKSDDIGLWFGMICLGFILSMITMYFQSYYLAVKHPSNHTLLDHLKLSVVLFFRFKWVTVSFMGYFFISLFVGLFFILGVLMPMIPQHLQLIMLSSIDAITSTLLQVFILRLFLYIKPMVNLGYN